MPTGRVILGVDESAAGLAALHWAIAEAASAGRPLVLVRAFTPAYVPSSRPGFGPDTAVEPDLAHAIATARERLADGVVEATARPGEPDDALLDLATRADLIVVGVPGHRHWLAHQATAHLLLREAPGPLIVVPPPRRTIAEPGSHVRFAGHVVVGVDGSVASRAALEFGFAYAARHRQPLVAVHVSRRVDDTDVWFDDQFLETHLGSPPPAATMLSSMVEPLESTYPQVAVKRAVLAGGPRSALLETARGAALLALGRPRPGLLESITHAAIDDAPCPVAIVAGP